jgi:hypothetical protein
MAQMNPEMIAVAAKLCLLASSGTRNPRQPISSPTTVAQSRMTVIVAVKAKERDVRPGTHLAKAEILGEAFVKLFIVKATQPSQPDECVDRSSVAQWDQVASDLVTGSAPLPPKG